ncbi:MAG: hypothetical protein HOW59_37085 [Nonomuraea sp.]|nr:hypothetical protein [Nonomuraea sp.]NUQ33271.1 hypothetical protein [Dermatophilaceae bacterium]NUR81089.1 hypothetical protein [Dermatophilaceae bacterium]
MSTTLTRPALEGVIVDAPRAVRIFGREPAALLGIIEALLAALVAFGLGVTNESSGLIAAVISLAIGAYSAWATKDTLLGVLTGLAKAIVALVVYYGVTLTAEQIGAIVTLVPVFVGFWQRTQTTPVAAPVDPSPTQVTPSPVDVVPDQTMGAGLGNAVQGVADSIYGSDTKVDAALHGTADPLDAPNEDYVDELPHDGRGE